VASSGLATKAAGLFRSANTIDENIANTNLATHL
jgi:hypothetical protein